MLVCVGIASYDGKVCAATTDALLADTILGSGHGVYFLVQWVMFQPYVGLARDLLAERFLGIPEAKSMVMIDADIAWKAGDLLKLVNQPQEVIGATYRPKLDEEKYHVRQPIERVGKLYRVGGLPGGFLKIERTAFGRMNPTRFSHDGVVIRDFFPVGERDGIYFGEDYGFCQLWRETGEPLWLDPSIHLRHYDGARYFTGDPRKWLRGKAQNGIADRRRQQPHQEDHHPGMSGMDQVGDARHQ